MNKYEISWAGIVGFFRLVSKSDYENAPHVTLLNLYYQCNHEERNRLRELYPEVVMKLMP